MLSAETENYEMELKIDREEQIAINATLTTREKQIREGARDLFAVFPYNLGTSW